MRDETVAAKRVLLVEDEAMLGRAYARVLCAAGYEVRLACDGDAALAALEDASVDLVLSDLHMPSLGGLSLLKALRERDEDAPVVLMTGSPSSETVAEAMDAGAAGYLLKPVAQAELLDAIGRALLEHGEEREAKQIVARIHQDEHLFEAALEKLYPVYQPIVSWSERRIVGYEAFAHSAEPALSGPWVLLAAATSLDRVGDLRRVIRTLAPMPFLREPLRPPLFLTLHEEDLREDGLLDPRSPLALMADRVVLEITPTQCDARSIRSLGGIGQLQRMGFGVAIDELGAGYAGLEELASLRPSLVKLDPALVRDVHRSETAQRLIRSLVEVYEPLDLEVVGQGIECAEELHALVALGCDRLQGDLLSPPRRSLVEVDWDAIEARCAPAASIRVERSVQCAQLSTE
ncbi:MAG: EAL domain-containing protein [Myxococcales bacterium]|nr:EAL domain-containing protein [Myxococcales bacterium]